MTTPLHEIPTVNRLQGYHITDNPQIVLNALHQGIPLDRGKDVSLEDDLLAGGLYFSEVPWLWVGRSSRKWNFVERITQDQRVLIAEKVREDNRLSGERYLTTSEKERVARYLEEFVTTGRALYLQILSEQPFNFATWKPEFLMPLGMVNAQLPHQVSVEVQGTFADITDVARSADLVRALRGAGYDGMFLGYSMAVLPQAVVWNNQAVVRFGKYLKKEARLLRQAQ